MCKKDRRFFIAKLLMLLLMLFVKPVLAGEGTESGGGGGLVHDQFIKAGNRVMYYLKYTEEGREIVKQRAIDLCRLQNALDENLIFVFNDQGGMTDLRGSDVDGFSSQWKITLAKSQWENYLKSDADIYWLVFKEMLRSEGTYFDQAMQFSQALKPFPKTLFISKSLNNPMETAELNKNCLNSSDLKLQNEIKQKTKLFVKQNVPRCGDQDVAGLNEADALINLAKQGRCEMESSPCQFSYENINQGDFVIFKRNILWRGQTLLSLPIGNLNKTTQETVRNMFFYDLLEDKMAELEHFGICKATGKSWNGQVRNLKGKIVEQLEITSDIIPFEFLRKRTDRTFNQIRSENEPVKTLGLGSEIELLDPIVTSNTFGASFLRVKVLSNTLTVAPKMRVPAELAKPGDEGYVLTSMTNFLPYMHPSKMILDK